MGSAATLLSGERLDRNVALPADLHYTVELPFADALRSIGQFPDDEVGHAKANLLHPVAIYNRATERVVSAFEGVLAELASLPATWPAAKDFEPPDTTPRLLVFQHELLHALSQWIDLSSLVLVAALPAPVERTDARQPNHKWLAAVAPETQDLYWRLIQPVQTDIGRLVNAMKHRGCTLAPIFFYSPQRVVGGYYLQGLSWNPGGGADLEIHPAATAFTFNRDLRLRLLQWLWLDRSLSRAAEHIAAAHGISIGPLPPERAPHALRWGRIFAGTSSLPKNVFMDELLKPFPQISCQNQGVPTVAAGVIKGGGVPLGPGKLNLAIRSDRVTNHGRALYMGPPDPKEIDLTRTM